MCQKPEGGNNMWKMKRDLDWIFGEKEYSDLTYIGKEIINSKKVKVYEFSMEMDYYRVFYQSKNKLIIFAMYDDEACSFSFVRDKNEAKLDEENYSQILSNILRAA